MAEKGPLPAIVREFTTKRCSWRSLRESLGRPAISMPFTSKTTALEPAFLSLAISYSEDSAHSRNAASWGNESKTALSRSQSPSRIIGASSAPEGCL